jgi:hypothetical protein
MSDLLNSASLVMIPSGYAEDKVYSAVPTDGSGDLSFTRASNGTRVNSAGLVEVCPWNLVTYSEDLTNGAWLLASATIGANATTAPNGTATAESFTSSATLANHVTYQLLGYTGGSYTYSVYVKKANSRYVYIKLVGDASQWVAAVFDLNDGTLTKSEATGWTGLTASSESVGNGWYRLIVSGSGATSVNFNVGIQYTNTATPTFSAYADASFTGTGTIDYYIWGAQLNIGSTAKPYFPTTDRLNVPRLTYQNGGGGCPSLLLEKQSTNFAIYSQDLTQSVSFLTGGSVTDNNTTSPDGTQNADKFTVSSGSSGHTGFYESPNGTNGSPFTASIFLKAGTGRYFLFRAMTDTYATRYGITIDLQSGTILSTNTAGSPTGTASKIENFGNGWYRVSLTMNCINTQIAYVWAASNTATPSLDAYLDYSYTGNGTDSYYIWGMTLENSSYATSYIPTTSASATRVADACYKTGISSLIGQTEGTFFAYIKLIGNTGNFNIINTANNSTNSITMHIESSQLRGYAYANSVIKNDITGGTLTSGNIYKVAYAYKSGSAALYYNGIQIGVGSNTFTFSSSISEIAIADDTTYFSYQESIEILEAVIFPTRLTNAELASLTTL